MIGDGLTAHNLDSGLTQVLLLQLSGRAQRHDGSLIHNGNSIAELLRLFNVMSRDQDGALLVAQLIQQLPNLEPHLRIEARSGFIEKQELRVVDQTQG